MRNRKVVSILSPEVKLCWGYSVIQTVVGPAFSTYNTEFVKLAIGTMNLVDGNSCFASGRRLRSQHFVSSLLIETSLFMGALFMQATFSWCEKF